MVRGSSRTRAVSPGGKELKKRLVNASAVNSSGEGRFQASKLYWQAAAAMMIRELKKIVCASMCWF
jgi:hypothetical protein